MIVFVIYLFFFLSFFPFERRNVAWTFRPCFVDVHIHILAIQFNVKAIELAMSIICSGQLVSLKGGRRNNDDCLFKRGQAAAASSNSVTQPAQLASML